MRAVILAAGLGRRLALADGRPKSLLEFGGVTLMARHLAILAACGVARVDVCLGYRAAAIEAELKRTGAALDVTTTANPEFDSGSILSLLAMRPAFTAGDPVLFMDADVLYDRRLLDRLLAAGRDDCYLMDRALEPGDEPVKLCFKDGVLVDLDKRPRRPHDSAGEWVGFARFKPATARRIITTAERLVRTRGRNIPYEDAFRAVLIATRAGAFSVIDASDLPWIEIDFPADLLRAETEIMPRLEPLA